MILMGEATGRYVTVFTDIDCTYCRQFHKTVPELQKRGLQVRYLMFPRAGLQSESYLWSRFCLVLRESARIDYGRQVRWLC